MIAALMMAVVSGVIAGVPPAPPGAPPNNYVQGAAPVKIGNQVILMVNAGHCCVSPEEAWEGVYAYSGRQWWPLWGANDWGREPWRGEHEIAYPSVVWWERQDAGAWVAAYAATPVDGEEPRVWGGWAMTRLDPLMPWPLRNQRWIRPLGPGRVWGVFPIALLAGEDGQLVVWAWDSTAGQVVAYSVDGEMGARLIVVASFQAPIGGVGLLPTAPVLTDVARGQWGELYALEGLAHTTTEVREWVSWPRCGWPAGWWWLRTGRSWSWPGHTVFDCGYLRDHLGGLVEPRVVVCNTSPGGVYADSGLWELRWWADDGADVPLEWISRPVSVRLRRGGVQ